MPDQHGRQELTYLQRVNVELTRGLRRCHLLIEDCRAHLTPANSDEPPFIAPGDAAPEDQEHLG
jgi:hypothetical protein